MRHKFVLLSWRSRVLLVMQIGVVVVAGTPASSASRCDAMQSVRDDVLPSEAALATGVYGFGMY